MTSLFICTLVDHGQRPITARVAGIHIIELVFRAVSFLLSACLLSCFKKQKKNHRQIVTCTYLMYIPVQSNVQSLYGVFPIPLGHFTLVTYPRRELATKVECACVCFFLLNHDVVNSRKFMDFQKTLVDICEMEFCRPLKIDYCSFNVINPTELSVLRFQLLATVRIFKVKTIHQ